MSQNWWNNTTPDSDIDRNWFMPIPESKPQTRSEIRYHDQSYFVQHVDGFVPFWIKGIEAAERGEPWKLETFLDSRPEQTRRKRSDPTHANWSNRYSQHESNPVDASPNLKDSDIWDLQDEGAWSPLTENSPPRKFKRGKKRTAQDGVTDDFVENIARQKSVSLERKRQMHSFFQMPTRDKLKKIDQLIHDLHHTS